MPLINHHGGACCGARHLYSFAAGDENNPDLINTALQGVPVGRMVEVILNQNQMDSYPNTLRRLADLGFVMVSHYNNNNHGPNRSNYVFHRCDVRRTLQHRNWTGMVASAGLSGNLPAVPRGGGGAPRRDEVIGQRVMVINRNSQWWGGTGTIEGVGRNEYDTPTYSVRLRANGLLITLVQSSFRVEHQAPVADAPNEPQRHENADVNVIVAPVPPPPARVEEVFSTYHCVFRDGRRGAGYDNVLEATANLGRRTRIDKRSIMSDGSVNWGEDIDY